MTRIMAGACLSIFAVVYAAYLCGARINRTHSLPKGLYWVVDKPPERGDIVAFWPQDTEAIREAVRRGYLIPGAYNDGGRGGYGLILKKLLAVPGDAVSLTDAGVVVNGSLIPNTKPLDRDNLGDPLPVVRFENRRLGDNEALFLSDHLPRSFDARYFGVQDLRQIVEVVVPVWTTFTGNRANRRPTSRKDATDFVPTGCFPSSHSNSATLQKSGAETNALKP
ncbi:MAG: conjugative transfer signal peptidase TraF [Planctomycetota bacterium]|nr:conjugative transfer signal peptidase TraF [Planctomycetota bacterium]